MRTVERLPGEPPDDRGLPDLIALVTGPVVVFDHLRRALTIVAPCPLGDDDDEQEAAYWRTVATIAELKGRLSGPLPRPPTSVGDPVLGPVTSNMSREVFEAAVERCREYIFAGDAFQIVPSQRFSASVSLDPFAVYRGLRTVNPSPYMFFFETGEVTLVGSSPEMLVKVEGGTVEMHPIAGSRPRGGDELEDERLGEELLADPKERAEHVMLVDLGRNDLGRVSEIGTVRVTDLMDVRRYSHVMHIESSVIGRARRGAARVRRAAGDVPRRHPVRGAEGAGDGDHRRAGAHQARALRRRRGLARLGRRASTSCITIRTIVCKDGLAHVQAGAGHRGRLGRRDRVRGDPEQGGARCSARSRSRPARTAGDAATGAPTRTCAGIARSRAETLMAAAAPTPRVALIDNYDSFTYNLVQYLGELGAEVLVHRHDRIDVAGLAALGPTHLVVSPGPKTPDEAGDLGGRDPRAGRAWCRSSASASATRRSGRRSAAGWCAGASRCTARPARSRTTAGRSSRACRPR